MSFPIEIPTDPDFYPTAPTLPPLGPAPPRSPPPAKSKPMPCACADTNTAPVGGAGSRQRKLSDATVCVPEGRRKCIDAMQARLDGEV